MAGRCCRLRLGGWGSCCGGELILPLGRGAFFLGIERYVGGMGFNVDLLVCRGDVSRGKRSTGVGEI